MEHQACGPRRTAALEIAPSVAHRTSTNRKRGSQVGFIVDPFRLRCIWYDSGEEQKLLFTFIANPHVVDIREQQQQKYLLDGVSHEHYLDYLITTDNGVVYAYSVRPSEGITEELETAVNAMREQIGRRVAHHWEIISTQDVHWTLIENSMAVVECAKDFDYVAMDFLKKLHPLLDDVMTLADFNQLVDGGETDRGARAAIALIQQGLWAPPAGQSIFVCQLLRRKFTK